MFAEQEQSRDRRNDRIDAGDGGGHRDLADLAAPRERRALPPRPSGPPRPPRPLRTLFPASEAVRGTAATTNSTAMDESRATSEALGHPTRPESSSNPPTPYISADTSASGMPARESARASVGAGAARRWARPPPGNRARPMPAIARPPEPLRPRPGSTPAVPGPPRLSPSRATANTAVTPPWWRRWRPDTDRTVLERPIEREVAEQSEHTGPDQAPGRGPVDGRQRGCRAAASTRSTIGAEPWPTRTVMNVHAAAGGDGGRHRCRVPHDGRDQAVDHAGLRARGRSRSGQIDAGPSDGVALTRMEVGGFPPGPAWRCSAVSTASHRRGRGD